MASSTLTRLSDPSAVIQFNLGSDGATDASGQVIYLYMHRFNFLSDITVHVPLSIMSQLVCQYAYFFIHA